MGLTATITFLTPAIALLAVAVAWLGHRVLQGNAKLAADISRSNAELATNLEAVKQIAQNRQVWINDLRADLAKFHATALLSHANHELVQDLLEVEMRIMLRMNPSDRLINELDNSMYDLRVAKNAKARGIARNRFIKVCQEILKCEWDVLKTELKTLSIS